jgi:hypothetical protein
VARLRDGTEAKWSTELSPTVATTVTPTLPASTPLSRGTTALLIVRVGFVDPNGLSGGVVSLGGRVVESGTTGLVVRPTEWEGRILTTPAVDPHDSVDLDDEAAP